MVLVVCLTRARWAFHSRFNGLSYTCEGLLHALTVALQVPVGPVGRQTAPREMSQPRALCARDLLARIGGSRLGLTRREHPLVEAALPFGRARSTEPRMAPPGGLPVAPRAAQVRAEATLAGLLDGCMERPESLACRLRAAAVRGLIAISGLTPTTPFLVIVGQWGGAGGACCEDHLAFLR